MADARDLEVLGDACFDAVLLMGPLYHLVLEADRDLVLQQMCHRLLSGGLLFSAFISRYGLLGEMIEIRNPGWEGVQCSSSAKNQAAGT